ncbi:hemerythrin domain-containing protein [Microtetraspora malaysiensis]|uniref:hemerythrin domain-containing protein n=1 Tax=Microtetraspora malaysiensis TaxID=161358 RepID=UPI00082BA39F|nr:hemerythrin domain-containing protein [Microtetraspora malaysiensis]
MTSPNVPNVLGFRITHRAMRGDARRLAKVTQEIAAGRQSCDARRAAAIRDFTVQLCAGIHHHHSVEDEALWPLLVRSAGPEVDLTDLSDDHSELDPLLDEVRAAMADPAQAAKPLARLADLLDEHIEEEERVIFPIIERQVSPAAWNAVEKLARKGGKISFELPRIEQYALPSEMAKLRKLAGPVLVVLLALMRGGHRRRQRLIFGAA